MAAPDPVRAFLSYAHEDHAWRDALLGQLGWLTNSGQLEVFYDPPNTTRSTVERPDQS